MLSPEFCALYVCVCVCVRACVRACVHACVRACVCVRRERERGGGMAGRYFAFCLHCIKCKHFTFFLQQTFGQNSPASAKIGDATSVSSITGTCTKVRLLCVYNYDNLRTRNGTKPNRLTVNLTQRSGCKQSQTSQCMCNTDSGTRGPASSQNFLEQLFCTRETALSRSDFTSRRIYDTAARRARLLPLYIARLS